MLRYIETTKVMSSINPTKNHYYWY